MMLTAKDQALSEETCYWKDVWQRLYTMRQMWQLCDISLFSEDGRCFKAHSIILAASSSVFHTRLLNGNNTFISQNGQSELHLSGIATDVLQVTLDFIYGVVPETIIDFKRLQKGADKLGIAAAATFCRQQLNELEELAKGDKNPADRPKEVLQRTGTENVDPLKKQDNSNDKVNFPKCPYLTNMTAESSHIIPLKKRFLLKVLSQLKNEEVPLSTVERVSSNNKINTVAVEGKGHSGHKIISSAREEVEQGEMYTVKSVKKTSPPALEEGSSAEFSTVPNQPITSTYSSAVLEDSNKANHCITPQLSAVGHGTISKALSNADDRNNMIPHHVPDLGFTDMGIQCPHLQKLVGQVDSYMGFPMDVIENLHDVGSNAGDDELREKAIDTDDKFKETTQVTCSASLSDLDDVSTKVIANFVDDHLLPKRTKGFLETGQWESSVAEPLFTTPMHNVLPPHPTSAEGHMTDPSSQSCQNGKKFSNWAGKHNNLTSNTKTVNSCPVKVQSTCIMNGEQNQTPNNNLVKMEIINTPESDSLNSCNAQDKYLEQNQCPMQMDMEEDSAPADCFNNHNNQYHHVSPGSNMNNTLIKVQGGIPSVVALTASSQDQNTSEMCDSSPDSVETHRPSLMLSNDSLSVSQTSYVKTIPGVEYFSTSMNSKNKQPIYAIDSQAVNINTARNSKAKTFTSKINELGISVNHNEERQHQYMDTMFHENVSNTNAYYKEQNKPSSSLSPSESDSETSDNTDPEFTVNPENKMDNKTILDMLERSHVEDRKQYTCVMSGCDYSNKNIEYVQSHLYHRHGHGSPHIKCMDCHRRYFSESQLKTHKKQTHEGGSKCRLLTCEDCEEKFKNSQALLMHRLKAHGKGKLFSCEDCSFKSPRKKDLQGHMISQHGKAPLGVRVYQCELCEYKCIDRNRFSEHEASHTQQRSFQCDHCGNYYATRRGLRNHLKYHSNERPHKCNICNAAFKVRAKLRDHIRLLHLNKGEKPYKCGYCEFQAAVRGNVNQHIRNTHKGQQILVIDLKREERKHVKDYDYANMTGSEIKEVRDASAAGYASVGKV